MDLIEVLSQMRQQPVKKPAQLKLVVPNPLNSQLVLPKSKTTSLRSKLKNFMSCSPRLYNLLFTAYGKRPAKKNLDAILDLSYIGILPEVNILGLGVNGKNNIFSTPLFYHEENPIGAKFLLWGKVLVYLLLGQKDTFVFRAIEEQELFVESTRNKFFERRLNVTSVGDIKLETALGLVENYSGLFSGEGIFYMREGDYVSAKTYFKSVIAGMKRELRTKDESRTIPRITDDDDDDEVYGVFGGKEAYEKHVNPNWLEDLWNPQ